MPKFTQIRLQFFTPPGSNKTPGIEDVVDELRVELEKIQKLHAEGKTDAVMPQPYLGSMLILQAWLTDPLFLELMDVQ